MVTPQLAMDLDRIKETERSAAYVLTQTERFLDKDPKEFNINRTIAVAESGQGAPQAKAVVETLDEWGLKGNVVALSFDTSVSNTEKNQRACVLIEQELQKDLLYLACGHHIFELLRKQLSQHQKCCCSKKFKHNGSL